ncbi:MAG: SUMF1/EgtB/PvdO family nonheme iron enzyme [Aeromonadales bacterium]|nr:SUMF1/EgtB/PvdO family nonheme iron enzyme [Aeromonadales bacterium]
MKKSLLSVCLTMAIAFSASAQDVQKIFNPNPLKDDVVLSTPCNGLMVFRKVYTSQDKQKLKDKSFKSGSADNPSPMAQNPNLRYIQGAFHDKDGFFYLISKYELMQGQYLAITNPDKCPSFNMKSRMPMVNISYFEAVNAAHDYSLYLMGAKDAYTYEGQKAFARLPTDEEWEYACRGGNKVTQSEFEANLPPMENSDLGAYAWYQGAQSANGKLQVAGLKKPNPLGIFDMLGNAQEMTLEPFKAVRTGRLLGQAGALTVHGGSYLTNKDAITSSLRAERNLYVNNSDLKAKDTGTRFVLGLAVVNSMKEAKELNAQVEALGDGEDSDNNALKGASQKIAKIQAQNKKDNEEFQKQKAMLQEKNEKLNSDKTSLEQKNEQLNELNSSLTKLNDSLTKSNEELTKQLGSLKEGVEQANAQRQNMQDVAITANLRLGGFLCKTIGDEFLAINYFLNLKKVTQSQCDSGNKGSCPHVKTAESNLALHNENMRIITTYYGDTMANAVANYGIKNFKDQLANAKAAFGSKGDDYSDFIEQYYKHLSEYKKLSKDATKNKKYWSLSCKNVSAKEDK